MSAPSAPYVPAPGAPAPQSTTYVAQGRFYGNPRISSGLSSVYPYRIGMMICGAIGIVFALCCIISIPVLMNRSYERFKEDPWGSGDNSFTVAPILGFFGCFGMFVSCVCLMCGYQAHRYQSMQASFPPGAYSTAHTTTYGYNPQPQTQPFGAQQPHYAAGPQFGNQATGVVVTHTYQPQPQPNVPYPSEPVPPADNPPPYNTAMKQ